MPKDAHPVISDEHLQPPLGQVQSHGHLRGLGVVERVVQHLGEADAGQVDKLHGQVLQQRRQVLFPHRELAALRNQIRYCGLTAPEALGPQTVAGPGAFAFPMQVFRLHQPLQPTRGRHAGQPRAKGGFGGELRGLQHRTEDFCVVEVKSL